MKEYLLKTLKKAVKEARLEEDSVALEYQDNPEFGDFFSNVAMVQAKKHDLKPAELAGKIIDHFEKHKPDFVKSVNVAGPGFINFFIKDEFLAMEAVKNPAAPSNASDNGHGHSSAKIMVEYTDPNPFKEFHIGHLMSNAIGESISRLIQAAGAKVIRANWQGDVGPHVAKAVWGAMKLNKNGNIKNQNDKNETSFWGQAYTVGAKAYEEDDSAKKEIEEINKKIYAKSDPEIDDIYEKGRKESLEAFEDIYKRLDTKFDHYFFEGTEGRNGEAIVREFLTKGIFEESEGAIIFPGEKYGLHTRVFITSHGLPTYETKELGLNAEKFKLHPDLTQSIIVTANEQNDYFKVLLKVFELIDPSIAKKTKHLSHGLMRFASGKMASRKGNVVSATSLIDEVKKLVEEKMKGREFSAKEADEIAEVVAIAAIKYTILRQSIGSDIIFDSVKSISFEGDSGPYLQYSAVRAAAVLEKAKAEIIVSLDLGNGSDDGSKGIIPEEVGILEKLLVRFTDIVARARDEYAPQYVATYLINLAGAFNSFYASQVIVDKNDTLSPYRVAITKSFLEAMTRGLWLLGIKVPKRM